MRRRLVGSASGGVEMSGRIYADIASSSQPTLSPLVLTARASPSRRLAKASAPSLVSRVSAWPPLVSSTSCAHLVSKRSERMGVDHGIC